MRITACLFAPKWWSTRMPLGCNLSRLALIHRGVSRCSPVSLVSLGSRCTYRRTLIMHMHRSTGILMLTWNVLIFDV